MNAQALSAPSLRIKREAIGQCCSLGTRQATPLVFQGGSTLAAARRAVWPPVRCALALEAPGAPAAPLGLVALHRDAREAWDREMGGCSGGTAQRAQGNDSGGTAQRVQGNDRDITRLQLSWFGSCRKKKHLASANSKYCPQWAGRGFGNAIVLAQPASVSVSQGKLQPRCSA